MPAVAKIKNTGVSVRKVKPLIDLIRGRTVTEAVGILSFMPSPTASQLLKLLKLYLSHLWLVKEIKFIFFSNIKKKIFGT